MDQYNDNDLFQQSTVPESDHSTVTAGAVGVRVETHNRQAVVERRLRRVTQRTYRQTQTHPSDSRSTVAHPPTGFHPHLFLSRELTWLQFNWRVLSEALDPRNPLLERLKFVGIVAANLDEFFMKRIGRLKHKRHHRSGVLSIDGRTPDQQIMACSDSVRRLEKVQYTAYEAVRLALQEQGVQILHHSELSVQQRTCLRSYLHSRLDLITPVYVESCESLRTLSTVANGSSYLLVTLAPSRHSHRQNPATRMAIVRVPVHGDAGCFVSVGQSGVYVHWCDVLIDNLDQVFPHEHIVDCAPFRVTRDASTWYGEVSATDALEQVVRAVHDRALAPVVRLVTAQSMSATHKQWLVKAFGLSSVPDCFGHPSPLCLADVLALTQIDRADLRDPPYTAATNSLLVPATTHATVFDSIKRCRWILLRFPYESFATSIEQLLAQASRDPHVTHVDMTLYRTSTDSRVIDHLVAAAQNGKCVRVVIELRATFDEMQNIRSAKILEAAGAQVSFGQPQLKTHCKLIRICRNEVDGRSAYVHIGTGNYHDGTATLYSDFGVLTTDEAIARDVGKLFDALMKAAPYPESYEKLLVAPLNVKRELVCRIRSEIKNVQSGRMGRVVFKANALEDPDITRELYAASQAGVSVDLLIRDTCRLRPGVMTRSDRVRVVSVIGRFLEHSRLFYFYADGREDYFLGSADLMTRNLERRIEVLCPVEPDDLKHQLKEYLDAQLCDQLGAWDMQSDGRYRKRPVAPHAEHSQTRMMRRTVND